MPAIIEIADIVERQRFGRFHLNLAIWLFLAMLIDGYDQQMLAYAAPFIVKAWGVKSSSLGPVFGASLFGLMVGAIAGGYLGDWKGRKIAILAGSGFLGICCLIATQVQSVEQLLWMRFLGGMGIGMVTPNAVSLGTEYASRRYQATVVTVLFIGYTVGGVIAAFISNELAPHFGWQVYFLVGGIAPLGVVLGGGLFLPESLRFAALLPNGRDQVAALLKRIGVDAQPDAVFAIREERLSGLALKHLLSRARAPATLLLWSAFFFNLMSMHFMAAWMPTVLQSASLDAGQAAIAASAFTVGGVTGGLVLSRFFDKFGIMPIAMALGLGTVLVGSLGSTGGSTPLLLALMFGGGFCVIGSQTNLNSTAVKIYPTAIRSNGVGCANAVGRLGSVIGPVVGGVLIGMNLPLNQLFYVAAVPVMLAGLLCFALGLVFARLRAPGADAVGFAAGAGE